MSPPSPSYAGMPGERRNKNDIRNNIAKKIVERQKEKKSKMKAKMVLLCGRFPYLEEETVRHTQCVYMLECSSAAAAAAAASQEQCFHLYSVTDRQRVI